MLSSVGYTDKRAEAIAFASNDLQARNDVASPQVVVFAGVRVLSVPLDRDMFEPSKTMSDGAARRRCAIISLFCSCLLTLLSEPPEPFRSAPKLEIPSPLLRQKALSRLRKRSR